MDHADQPSESPAEFQGPYTQVPSHYLKVAAQAAESPAPGLPSTIHVTPAEVYGTDGYTMCCIRHTAGGRVSTRLSPEDAERYAELGPVLRIETGMATGYSKRMVVKGKASQLDPFFVARVNDRDVNFPRDTGLKETPAENAAVQAPHELADKLAELRGTKVITMSVELLGRLVRMAKTAGLEEVEMWIGKESEPLQLVGKDEDGSEVVLALASRVRQ